MKKPRNFRLLCGVRIIAVSLSRRASIEFCFGCEVSRAAAGGGRDPRQISQRSSERDYVRRTPETSRQGGKERLSSAHFIHFFVSAIDSDREAKKKNVNERGSGECGKGKQEVAIIRSFRWAKVGLSAP